METTLTLTGANLIAGKPSSQGQGSVQGVDPRNGTRLEPTYSEATAAEVRAAVAQASQAFRANRNRSPEEWATLLETIATEIESLGDTLVERVMAETGLPEGRVRGERGRTMGQLRLFASVVRTGDWVDARIETALPDRAPIPRPDIRSMLRPTGPVAVFGASNFPLAFSVAGGDTASALAAGCPVVCKAHPAHPGTSELVATAINRAVETGGFHPGTFSLVHGGGAEVGMALVRDSGITAVGFTGSLGAGRAIYDAAAARPIPIPVYAEMGSVNPVFVLPNALATRAEAIGKGLVGSVTLGSGQFCTNPGLVFAVDGPGLNEFAAALEEAVAACPVQQMLHKGIADGYDEGVANALATEGVTTLAAGVTAGGDGASSGAVAVPRVLQTDAGVFRKQPGLNQEIFGPATLLVVCRDVEEMTELAAGLEGSLTGTVHFDAGDLDAASSLFDAVEGVVGRVISNGFPTGVEVCHAMHHGGPYPSTTAPSTTSVGTRAILRFARPVCYQDHPSELLPSALRDENPLGILRMVDGSLTRDALS
ncbi:MAG: aldehyde dehydrogenase (NADP(+)) [Rhodothermales bacterium]|nr:aldehyde dehydrogenase (NADP(+)) [Rhodothermales bacterium]